MAFTQVALTGKITDATGAAVTGASLTFTLNAPMTDGATLIDTTPLSTTTNGTGNFTITLDANDDTTTVPTGTYYTVDITAGTFSDKFNVIVPHNSGPTVQLFSLAQVATSAPGVPYVSQLIAGTGITLSPTNGTGQVIVTSSGGGGGSVPAEQADGDLLVGSGGTWARLARGSTSQQIVVRSDGTIAWTDAPVISVKAWGAVGDGTTVDTTNVQSAANSALTVGGTLYYPPGTYIQAQVTYGSNLTVKGAGLGATVLKMDPAVYTNTALYGTVSTALVARVAPASSTVSTSNCIIEDLTIDGNQSVWGANTTNRMMGFYLGQGTAGLVSHCKMRNVEIRNCMTYAFDIENVTDVDLESCWAHDNGYSSGTGTHISNDGFTLIGSDITCVNCRSYNNSGNGFLAGQNGFTWYRVKLIGCTAANNTKHGASLGSDATGALYDSAVLGGSYINSATGCGIQLTVNAQRCTVTGAKATGNFQNGIKINNASYNAITGNSVSNNAVGGSSNPEIYLATSATYNSIAGNIVTSTTATHAISEQNNTCDFNVITGNNVSSTSTTILPAGTHTTTSNNLGYDTINGITISGTPSSGQVLTATSATAANWQPGAIATGTWTPAQHNLLTWAFDPGTSITSAPSPTAGTAQVIVLNTPVATTVTNIIMHLSTVGATLTAGQCFAALYQNGTLLATTADQATNWSTGGAGVKTMALSTAQAVAAGKVAVVFWANGTTMPLFGRGDNNSVANVGLATANSRYATANTGLTTTAPSTLGTLTASSVAYWAGLS